MGRHTFFVNIALTFLWVILMEELSWQTIAIGLFMSMLCLHFIAMFLNFEEVRHVNFFRLAKYPLWLIVRIYTDAIFLIKCILKGSKWGIITEDLHLKNESLQILLSDSITLTPGSVYISRDDNKIKLLCIGSKKYKDYPEAISGLRAIENVLKKADKSE